MLKNLIVGLALSSSLTACFVEGHARVVEPAPVATVEVDEEPPPPQTVVVETRPGYIWIEGRYERRGNRWVWANGRYERERSGSVWEQGRWERRGNRHVWVEGRWRAGGGPVIREHRSEPVAAPPPPGPVVRDHR